MRERDVREYLPGAVWQTVEQDPRYLSVLGNVAIDERMLLVEMDGRKVWLQRGTGTVYVQGRAVAQAECVRLGGRPDPEYPV